MKLIIGEEVYQASGTSLNKAKHAVAEIALSGTKLDKPNAEQMKKRRAGKFFNFLFYSNFKLRTKLQWSIILFLFIIYRGKTLSGNQRVISNLKKIIIS
jgi:hypothetical protein